MRKLGVFAAVSFTTLMVFGAPAGSDPPGNNGTIKVDGVDFDDHPHNEPHVDCRFQLDWYGFDAGNLFSTVEFVSQAPTKEAVLTVTGSSRVLVGADDNGGGGSETGLDASEVYILSFVGEPHENQGFHVKLTIHTEGSQGADVKHKVFWVTPCEAVVPTTTTTTTTTTTVVPVIPVPETAVVLNNRLAAQGSSEVLTLTPEPEDVAPVELLPHTL